MSEALVELKKIGAEQIHEDTHIPIQHVKSILNSDFSSLSKIQFSGFISILEREYKLDLSELKESAKIFFDEKKSANLEAGLFVAPKQNYREKVIFGASIVALIFIILIYKISTSDAPVENVTVDNTLIDSVVEEMNTTKDKKKNEDNISALTPQKVEEIEKKDIEAEVVEVIEPEVVENSFSIEPKSKVWFGYIDIDKNKRYQKTFSHEMDLNASKRWLLVFGHGHISMFVNGEEKKFSRGKVRFYYADGELKAISAKEFKRLNRGRKW